MSRCLERSGAPASRDAFVREAEAPAVPAVYRGLATAWPAVALWDPRRRGLEHLAALAAAARVEAMLSTCDVFAGSTRDHEPAASAFTPRAARLRAALTSLPGRSVVRRSAAFRRRAEERGAALGAAAARLPGAGAAACRHG